MSRSTATHRFIGHTGPTTAATAQAPPMHSPPNNTSPRQYVQQPPSQLIPRNFLSSSRPNGPRSSLGLVDRSVLRDDSDESDDADFGRSALPTRPPPSPRRTETPPAVAATPPLTSQPGAPSDESPASTVSSAAPRPPAVYEMARASSIDSAISTMSHSSWAHKPSQDGREHTAAEIRSLIATAGSAENLVQHLLRDKAHAAAQNAQLWKLVDKQRALLLGLNKDLERVTKERDRYRKKVKEALPTAPTPAPLAPRQIVLASARHETQANGAQLASSGANAVEGRQRQQVNGVARSPVDDVTTKAPQGETDPSSLRSENTRSSLKLPTLATQMPAPCFNLTEATPLVETPVRSFANSRKNAPKSLDLKQTNQQPQPAQPNGPVLELADLDPESMERGRRKTREEDDRERETALQLEREARSRSLKEKRSKDKLKSAQVAETTPGLPQTVAIIPQPQTRPNQQTTEPLPGAMTALQPPKADVYSSLAAPLRSPGLPASPRPVDRPVGSPLPAHMADQQQPLNSLPMSPRNAGFPLSPRAPKQPLPPGVTPGTIPEQKPPEYTAFAEPVREPERSQADTSVMNPSDPPPVNRSLVSPACPDLLFPPNAIPSIQIRVASSRLKPSRFSVLGLKPQEETSVYNLSVFSRASHSELWRVEKIPAALPHLDQQLRQRVANLPKVPDRRLFSGHAPATVDARRTAIEAYFDELLDTPVDEQSALLICKFLSTDVLEPGADSNLKSALGHAPSSSLQIDSQGRLVKSGFLTKKGKNFGGWKSRYFVLDSPELRYFEAQGGAHLGTIKLVGARIGRQTSDGANEQNDDDGQFRHAFLILEPKRKDSASYLRHVLCAESDAERDEWVRALLHYVDEKASDPQPVASPTAATSDGPNGVENLRQLLRTADFGDQLADNYAKASSPTLGPSGSSSPTSSASLHHAAKSSKDTAFVRPVFGLPLAEAVELCPPDGLNVPLPAVVYRTIEYLRAKNAANEEGLFRLSGSNLVIRTLKDRFNTEGDVDLLNSDEYYDVHAVASLFKTYLRELPSTLLTRELHLEFLAVLELDDKQNKVNTFNTLVHRLPDVNYALLRVMSEYLLEVVQNSDRNKMTVKNVGIVFSPTLNIPAPVFSMFLTEFDAIFDHRQSDEVRETLVSSPRRSNDDEIRSPRHQMFSDLPTTPFNSTTFPQNQQQQGHQQPSLQPSSHRSNPAATMTQKHTDPGAEFGMSPVQQPMSYETRHYVSIPQQHPPQQPIPPQPMYPPPGPEQPRQMQYRMLAPPDGGSEKAKRRESALFFG
ncbi:hypothetical protein DV736_g1166, partial [Chaetothyriales sp. CBS 134916]